MDVRFAAEQEALRDSAVRIVDRLGPRVVRDLEDAKCKARLDAAVEAAGWREIRGAGDGRAPLASAVEAAIVAEELGRRLAPTPFLGPVLAADLRRLIGAPPATAGETVALVADLSRLAEVTGTTLPSGPVAVDAGNSSGALVLVARAGGHGLAQVVLDGAPGGMDLTRPVVVTEPGAAAVPLPDVEGVLTPEDLEAWTALGLALTCADLVGIMRGAIDLAIEYASSRRQYGVPIGSFQAVQHLLADALVAMEGSRSAALHAAWAVDALPTGEAVAAAAIAKAYCSRAARTVCEIGIQAHGGIGNTWDCLAHVYLRRAVMSSDVLGGVGPSLRRVLDHNGIGGEHGLR